MLHIDSKYPTPVLYSKQLLTMEQSKKDISPYALDTEATPNGSQDTLVVKPIKTWRGYIWDTWELPKDQRWLLFKLDAFVLTFASVGIPSITRRIRELIWGVLDWLFPQESGSNKCQQCFP